MYQVLWRVINCCTVISKAICPPALGTIGDGMISGTFLPLSWGLPPAQLDQQLLTS